MTRSLLHILGKAGFKAHRVAVVVVVVVMRFDMLSYIVPII